MYEIKKINWDDGSLLKSNAKPIAYDYEEINRLENENDVKQAEIDRLLAENDK